MKTITKMKGLILLLMAVVLQSSAFAQEVITSTFKDKNLTTQEGVKWTGTASNFDTQHTPSNGLQFYGKNGPKYYTLTYANAKDVQSIELHYASTTKGEGTIEAKVGGQVFGEKVSVSKDAVDGKTHTFTSTSSLSGDVTLNLNVTANSLYISKVVITTGTGETTIIAAPTFSKEAGNFFTPFDLTIKAAEGSTIKYTLDNSEPTADKGTDYSNPIKISATTTVKAIAIKDGKTSTVATATYTLVSLTGNGSFENPYTVDDIEFLDTNTKGWFKGTIKGSYKEGGHVATTAVNTNLAVGDDNTLIPVYLPNGDIRDAVNVNDHPDFVGKEIIFYGEKVTYFNNPNGIKNTSKVYGLWNLSISDAGYSTYFTNVAFEAPADVEVGIVTGVEGNALTIDWTKYSAGKTVPANTGVLVKGNKGDYPYVIVNSSAQTPNDNLLKGSVAAEQTAGTDCKFYKLSMDDNGKNLGFYWGAADGAAFENAANKAYLAVPNAVAANLFGFVIEGDGTTGIESVEQAQKLVDVYTIDGVLVQKQVKANQALNGLRKGIYIVNGKKVIK